jgi:hypothetical protein
MVRRCLFLGPSSTVSSDRAWKFLAAKVGRFGVEEKPPYLAPRKHKIEGESCPSCHWLPRQTVYRPTARAPRTCSMVPWKEKCDGTSASAQASRASASPCVMFFTWHRRKYYVLQGGVGKKLSARRVFVADREWVFESVRASHRRNHPGWFRLLRCSII